MGDERYSRIEFIPLGQIASCQYGLSVKADPDGERPYIGMGQLVDGRVVVDGANRITVSESVAERYGLHVGDVLFNRTNSRELVGKTAIVADPRLDGAMFASYLVRLVIRDGQYSPGFLNIWMNTRNSAHQFAEMATPGVAQFNIRPSLLAQRFLVPDLPVEEQENVVRLNAQCDDVIATLRTLVAETSSRRRGLAQQLLTGKKRFSEFQGKPWIEARLNDFFQSKSEANVTNEPLQVYSCTKTVGIVPQAERFSKRLASADLSRYQIVSPGDLVYDPMLLWDGSIGFVPDKGCGVVSPAYETFSVRSGVNRDYLRALLKSHRLLYLYKKISRGTNTRRRKAMADDFLNLRVPMPSADAERDRIAACLVAAQREVDLLKEQADLYARYKRGLMAHLLSGEIKVPA